MNKEKAQRIKFSADDFRKFEDDEDFEFAYATIDFLSTKPNSHKYIYTEKVLKECAETALGKWVIAEYDEQRQDTTSHTDDQTILGYVPTTQEVEYRYDEDGYLIASIDVVISKLYSKSYWVLREDVVKNVSIEALICFTPETESFMSGIQEKEVEEFHICGITVLGRGINGSVPNAKITLTQMSEQNVEDIESKYKEYSKVKKDLKTDMANMSIILNKLDEISVKLESKVNKEESMGKEVLDKDKTKMEEVVENEATEETKEEVVEQVETEEETQMEEEIAKEEEVCKESEVEETTKLEEKLAETELELNKAVEKLASLEAELVELREFKETRNSKEKQEIVTTTLEKIKSFIDDSLYSKYKDSGEACKFEDIQGWRNEIMATVAEKALAKMSEIAVKEEGILDMGTVNVEQNAKKTSIYD